MSCSFGSKIKVTVFGESHGPAIGAVLDGLPPGIRLDLEQIAFHMARRAPGNNPFSTPRKEGDLPKILSGFYQGYTTGAPLCAVIENTNTHSKDYENLTDIPRPGHSDYAAFIKYHGFHDPRGGGHFSGRLTAPLVFAGSICRQILEERGIYCGSHIYSIKDTQDKPFDPVQTEPELLKSMWNQPFPTLDPQAGAAMQEQILHARRQGDSVGGVVEGMLTGVPAGIGGPLFGGIEGRLSSAFFGIPAVKGVEFGDGFACTDKLGSENNDAFTVREGTVCTVTNHHGGILGGITTGMPILFRLAFKPTPSISKEQQSVNLKTHEITALSVKGRHDPCIVLRALPVVESVACIAILDCLEEKHGTL